MSTVKGIIDNFLYSFIERYAERIYKDGETTVIHGIKVLDEKSAFTHGALVHAAAILYVNYVKNNDQRAESALMKLKRFVDIVNERDSVMTWGKLGILRGLYKLKKNGLLDSLSEAQLNRLNVLTDYSDFLDKETVELKNYATNYFQVALACSAYRELLGFDKETLSDKIEEKFIKIAFPGNGIFMDDELGWGRYDRYSLILSSEVSDLYRDIGRELPQVVRDNLITCARYALYMANSTGDGVNYGRSLSVHGDLTPVEILASALSRGLVEEDRRGVALSYIFCVLQKTLYFWYNPQKDSFDIWWDGRTTNDYRQIHRLLEVNMDMVSHLYALYDNIAAAGLENEQISVKLSYPNEWQAERIEFDDVHSAYILRYKDYLALLPFIGTKVYGLKSSYNPFPSICGIVEGSPESCLPFLIPEYTDADGAKLRAAHYVKKTELKRTDEGLMITATGNLMRVDEELSGSNITYRQDVLFSRNEIIVEFEVSSELKSAEMFTAVQNDSTTILVGGFDESYYRKIEDNNDFKTPHGAYSKAYIHYSSAPKRLGYKITIED